MAPPGPVRTVARRPGRGRRRRSDGDVRRPGRSRQICHVCSLIVEPRIPHPSGVGASTGDGPGPADDPGTAAPRRGGGPPPPPGTALACGTEGRRPPSKAPPPPSAAAAGPFVPSAGPRGVRERPPRGRGAIGSRGPMSPSPAGGRSTAAPRDPRGPGISRDASRRSVMAHDAGRFTGLAISRGPTGSDPTWRRAGGVLEVGAPEIGGLADLLFRPDLRLVMAARSLPPPKGWASSPGDFVNHGGPPTPT